MPKRWSLFLGLLGMAVPSVGHALDLFTSPLPLGAAETAGCYVLNAGTKPVDFTINLLGVDGTSLAAKTCTNIGPGEICVWHVSNAAGNTIVSCKIGASTKKLRGRLLNFDTGDTCEAR